MTENPPEKIIDFKIHYIKNEVKEKPQMTTDSNGNVQYFFSSEHVRIWGDRGILPKELVFNFFDILEKTRQEHVKMQEFKKANPGATQEELLAFLGIPRTLSQEESDQTRKDMEMSMKFHEFLNSNWANLIACLDEKNEDVGLFENVDDEEKFGIARLMTDSMYHLNKLLKEAILTNTFENNYEIKSVVKNSKEEEISLVCDFKASNQNEAEKVFEEYKKTMISKGLKIWMAHWGIANERGRIEYSCPMIEVMKLLAEEGRIAHFSVKEKQEHWSITKMLGMTKVIRQYNAKKKGTNKTVTRWIEQPLLEILGGEKEAEAGDKYPELIAVRVLAPQSNLKGFVPAIYSMETVRLHPKDVYLAFVIQTRAAQRDRGEKEISVDWKFLFEAGNLEGTAQSNPRTAKAITRKKMDSFQEKDIIKGWNEDSSGMRIQPKSQSAQPKLAVTADIQEKPT